MAWRIHLTNQAIQHLHILAGRQPALVAWTRPNRVHLYDLETGTLLEERTLPEAPANPHLLETRQSEAWQTYLGELQGVDAGVYLPYVQTGNLHIHTTDDGKLRAYRYGNQIHIATDGNEVALKLNDVSEIVSLAFDRALGTLVLLDDKRRLHIFQQHLAMGVFDVGLSAEAGTRAQVVISRGGGNIFVSDGQQIIAIDINGKVTHRVETHYFVGQLSCSPGGGMVIANDLETGVLRVYHGDSLAPTHQKFAIDLVSKAAQVQLLADLPPPDTGLSAIAAHNKGTICFAMSGVVCVTDVTEMDELPRARKLL
jgi:hypothetical protein